MVDASVFGAAMQHCGQNQWWAGLLEIWRQKEQLCMSFFCIQQSICLNALACCLRCDRTQISTSQLSERKGTALALAKVVFQERSPQTRYEFNCILSASLKLCHMSGTDEAFQWSAEILNWSESQPFDKTIVSYATILIVLEKQGRYVDVEDILDNVLPSSGELQPNEVVLGGLLSCAADVRDWERADRLWEMLVTRRGVQPHALAYDAYAKAHFLAARPIMAVAIMQKMFDAGVDQTSYRHAVNYLQYVLVACYASGCTLFRRRLTRHIAKWSQSIARESSTTGKLNWHQLTRAADKLLSEKDEIQLTDALVTYPAREQSVMKDWTD